MSQVKGMKGIKSIKGIKGIKGIKRANIGGLLFDIFVYMAVISSALICLFPMLHVISLSFSSSYAINAKLVRLLPVDISLEAYKFVISERRFFTAFWITIQRTVAGVAINLLFTVLAAYPLSKSKKYFFKREWYVWFFLIAILFSGGLVPTYLVVYNLGLINSFWALIIPGAFPIGNSILLQNFFKGIPAEIEESADMDGASHWIKLFWLFIPLSKPCLATIVLMCAVGHWNSWFDGMIYMNQMEKYPLQTYLQSIVVRRDIKLITLIDLEAYLKVSQRNANAAKIVIAMVPILLVYPFLQKYFAKGIIIGSVKG